MLYGPGTIGGDISYGEVNADGSYKKWDQNQFRLNSRGEGTVIGASTML